MKKIRIGTFNVNNLFERPRIMELEGFSDTGNQQIDYLLVSKPIFDNLKKVNLERRGIFKNNNPTFPQVTNKVTQASDHAAIFAEFEI